MAAVLVDSRDTFRTLLDRARARTDELAQGADDAGVFHEVSSQLERVAACTTGGAVPSRDDQ